MTDSYFKIIFNYSISNPTYIYDYYINNIVESIQVENTILRHEIAEMPIRVSVGWVPKC